MLATKRPVAAEPVRRTESCRLCILGAGISGLNALFVATRYLKKTDRVLLIDRNPRCGGMWNETYDYVRLHQPHPMFTVGNIKWRLGKPRDHLASRQEVLDYFHRALDLLRNKVDLLELYEHELVSTEEGSAGAPVKILVQSTSAGSLVEVSARQCIKAFGLAVPKLDPLPLTSKAVRSTTPDRLFSRETASAHEEGKPVYVIGGGKTGLDTAQALLERHPGSRVTLIVGGGTVFANRDELFPVGPKRWWGGHMVSSVFADLASRYDGTNDEEVFAYFGRVYGIAPQDGYQGFFFGVFSQAEKDALREGNTEIVRDRFVDVVDGLAGPELRLQKGGCRQIPSGSIVVNCTGYLMRQPFPEEPYLSPGGKVLSVVPSSAIHFLTSVSAYFLTHLFLLDRLPQTPLYHLDLPALRPNRLTFPAAATTLSFHNLLVILGSVPTRALLECGLDFDLWFPPHRRLVALARLRMGKDQRIAKCRQSLDRVRGRLGIRGGQGFGSSNGYSMTQAVRRAAEQHPLDVSARPTRPTQDLKDLPQPALQAAAGRRPMVATDTKGPRK